VDVDTILVLESRIRTLPSRDSTATASESYLGVRHPAGSEAVEEICLAGYLAVIHECVP